LKVSRSLSQEAKRRVKDAKRGENGRFTTPVGGVNPVMDFYEECLRSGRVLLGRNEEWSTTEKLGLIKQDVHTRFVDWYNAQRRSGKYKLESMYGPTRFWTKMHHLAPFTANLKMCTRVVIDGKQLRKIFLPPLPEARKFFTQHTGLAPWSTNSSQ
jgi:hypothetical protein